MRSLPIFVLLAACAGDGAVALDGVDAPTAACADDGADEFIAGMSLQAPGGESVAIMSASPTPPDVGLNGFELSITDGSGAPLTGTAVEVAPWMPLHGHGTTPPAYALLDEGGGTWSVDGVDLIMAGLWELTFDIGADPSAPNGVTFRFCLEG